MPVYRVTFVGTDPELSDAQTTSLTRVGGAWEGTESGPSGPSRHRALMPAASAQHALATVQEALTGPDAFSEFDVSPVRNAQGEIWRGSFYQKWQEIDWAVPVRAKLSDQQRAVLGALANAGEPSWIIAADPDVPMDRSTVESVLGDLERLGLVYSVVEQGGEHGRESDLVPWWAITDEGWDFLGFIKSPRYR